MPAVPFKANTKRRQHIPKQKRRLTTWPAYEASLRQRGDLTVWFTDDAVAAWRAEPRTSRGGQPWYLPLAILTALTLRAVFRLALRQTEGSIGSVIRLLGLDQPVPDHTTLSRRADKLDVPHRQSRAGANGMHLIVDSGGLKFHGPGEWQVEKHGAKTRRSHRSPATALMRQRMSMPRSPRIMPVPPLSCRRAPLRLRVKLPGPIQTPRPSSKVHCRRRTYQLAEGFRLQQAIADGGHDWPIQAGHRQRIAFADRYRSGYRGRGRHPCLQSHARV
jgi:hypothetical protein